MDENRQIALELTKAMIQVGKVENSDEAEKLFLQFLHMATLSAPPEAGETAT